MDLNKDLKNVSKSNFILLVILSKTVVEGYSRNF